MSESLRDYDRIEDRLRQHRQVDKRPIIIVEGPDDVLVLSQHVPREIMFPADGKINALRAVQSLNSWNISGVRAVVDADFDMAQNSQPGVIYYSMRDLEGMLISLGVLVTLLEHQGSASKLAKCGGAQSLSDQLISTAMLVASIRSSNRQCRWGLNFDKVDLASKADRRTLQVDLKRYVAALIQASETSASSIDVAAATTDLDHDGRGPRGRDVLALAGLALRSKAGSLPAAATDAELLGGQLRSSGAYALSHSSWLADFRVEISIAEGEVG